MVHLVFSSKADPRFSYDLRILGSLVSCVAFVSRGVADTRCQPLIMHGNILQHMRHDNGPNRGRRIQGLSCDFKMVGEVGLEPTKA